MFHLKLFAIIVEIRVKLGFLVMLGAFMFPMVKFYGYLNLTQLTLKDPLVKDLNYLIDLSQESLTSTKIFWFLDSGSSRHMTGDASMFINFNEKEIGHVTYGDNMKV